MAASLWEHFSVIPDPRVDRTKLHKLEDILVITLCAVICGAETWVDIADFARAKEAWLRTFLELVHGIPSHDTFGRVLAALDVRAFEQAFQRWILDLAGTRAGNQGTLHEDIRLFLDDAIARDFQGVKHDSYEQTEKGHGRLETRRCWTTSQIDWLRQRHDWPGLQSIAAVDCRRQIGEEVSTERRYFISSLPGRTAQRIGQAVRNHWSVQNGLHWSLDLCFGEDQNRARIGNAAENLSRVRRLALTLLKQETTTKVGIKAKRLMAGWDEKYLLRVLRI